MLLKLVRLALTPVLLVLAPSMVDPQVLTCNAGGDLPADPGKPSYPWQDHYIQLTRVGNHWMPTFGNGDSLSIRFDQDNGNNYPFGSDGFHETWYIPASNLSGTAPLYRLYSPTYQDHMDAPDPNAGASLGYSSEFILGYPYTTQKPGTSPITRYIKGDIFDHRTWLASPAPPGYSLGVAWSTATSTPRYGYQRFANLPDQCAVQTAALAMDSRLENSKLRVRFNPIWGNAIMEITHKPTGKQIVQPSIGDMLQFVLWYGGTGGRQLNPTQSGGADSGTGYGNTTRYAGSPVISTVFTGANPSTMTTEVKPLDFNHDLFQGNDPFHPLLWRGTFRATTTLSCRLNGVLREDVIFRRDEAILDPDTTVAGVANFASGGWFWGQRWGDCRTNSLIAKVIDLATGAVVTQQAICDTVLEETANPVGKGIMVTSTDGTFAIGLASLGPQFRIAAWSRCPLGCNNTLYQILVIDTMTWHSLSKTQWRTTESYWVIGSPTDVQQRLVEIYQDGGICNS